MTPTEDARLFFLDDEGVLFVESAQKLFHLNTTATFVWCLLEENRSDSEISTELQSTFDLEEATATDYLAQTETLLQSLGALRGFEQPHADETEPAPLQSAPQYHDDVFIAESHYHLLSSHIRLRFSRISQRDWIDPVLAHLTDTSTDQPETTIDVVEHDDGLRYFFRNGIPLEACRADNELAPIAKSLVWTTAVNAHEFFLDIHAGVVGDGEKCILLPAAPGSGKSTLTAALVHAGFEYFSDEVALLKGDDFRVEPVPLATCVKHTGVDVYSSINADIGRIAEHLRGDGKRVRYVPPPLERTPPQDTARPIGAIVFPKYDPDVPTRLEPIQALEALEALMQECLIVKTRLDSAKVARILAWVDETPCYRLFTGDLPVAVELIKTHLAPSIA